MLILQGRHSCCQGHNYGPVSVWGGMATITQAETLILRPLSQKAQSALTSWFTSWYSESVRTLNNVTVCPSRWSRPQELTVWVWACLWPRPKKEPVRREPPRKPRPWTGARGTNCSVTCKHNHLHHLHQVLLLQIVCATLFFFLFFFFLHRHTVQKTHSVHFKLPC